MSIGQSGQSYKGYAGLAKESNFGGGPAPAYFMDVVSDGFSGDNQHSYDDDTTRAQGRHRGEAGPFSDEGSVDYPVNPEGGIGLLLKSVFGAETLSTSDPDGDGTTEVGTHEFTPADDLPSLAVELALGDVATARHVGVGHDAISLEHTSEERLSGSSDFIAKEPDLSATKASPTYSDLRNFWYQDAAITFAGTDRTGDVQDVSVELARNLSPLFRNSRTASKMEVGDREATATVTLDFATEEVWELFLGKTGATSPQETTAEVAFNATWTSPETIANTSTNYSLAWDMPRCKIDTREASLDGNSLIAEDVELTALVDQTAGYDVKATLKNGVTSAY